jgi:tetrahydromethanopterin S-methyltransferase subunit F
LADGQVIFGIAAGSGADKGWNVSIRISAASDITKIQSQLESAGYTVQLTGSGGTDGGGLAATGPKYSVIVVIAKDDKGAIANYTDAPTTSGN